MNAAAAEKIANIFDNLGPYEIQHMVSWIVERWGSGDSDDNYRRQMRAIANDIKATVPLNGTLPTEHILHPGNESAIIRHVDSFLYEDSDIDDLVARGELSINYCRDCRSTNISPITILSHSVSIESAQILFKDILGDSTNRVILDVGSRLGVLLYGAHFLTNARKIVGVEFNGGLCHIQNSIIQKYGLQDRIEVVHNDIRNVPEIVQSADIIIFNNVFEWFLDQKEQIDTWHWLRRHITRRGTTVVTMPSIEKMFSKLHTEMNISDWLKEENVIDPQIRRKFHDDDFICNISVYTVL